MTNVQMCKSKEYVASNAQTESKVVIWFALVIECKNAHRGVLARSAR